MSNIKTIKKTDEKYKSISKYWYALFDFDINSVRETLSKKATNKREVEEIKSFKWIKGKLTQSVIFDFSLLEIKLNHCSENYFYIVTYDNKLLFEESVTFDEFNKIIFTGNFEFADIVSKVSYGNENTLSFAIKERADYIVGLSINNTIYKSNDFIASGNYDKDGFYYIHTDVAISTCKSFNVKVFYKDKKEKRNLYIFSDKRESFVFPNIKINDKFVSINNDIYKKQIPWSLFVLFEDNTSEHIMFPSKEIYFFKKSVSKVIFTDALDNDWEIKC